MSGRYFYKKVVSSVKQSRKKCQQNPTHELYYITFKKSLNYLFVPFEPQDIAFEALQDLFYGAFGAGGRVGAEEFFDAMEVFCFRTAADGFHGPAQGQAAFAVAGDERLPVLFHEIPPDIPAQGVCAHAGENADAVLWAHVAGHSERAG